MADSPVVEVIDVKGSLARLNAALGEYLAETKKDPGEELARRVPFITANLYSHFRDTTPPPSGIIAAAAARGWRMGRKDGAVRGISTTVWKKVDALIGSGQWGKSVIARVTKNSEGLSINILKYGKTGRFVSARTRTGKAVQARHSVAVYANSKGGMVLANARAVAKAMGAIVLTRQALAVALEANLRQSGRRFLGISWLHKRWRKLSQSDERRAGGVFRVFVENKNPRSQVGVLGTAELASTGQGSAFLHLVSNAAGMDQPAAQGIIARVLAEETLGLQTYLLQRSIRKFNQSVNKT